jgi:DNA-binding GntR family transcriptional regulator
MSIEQSQSNEHQPQSRPANAVAAAADGLRRLIVTGELAPGQELSQVALARLVGVSTTPLREALRELEAEGLIESRQRRRPRVAPFDVNDLEAIYSYRVFSEAMGIALTVPVMTVADRHALREDLATLRTAGRARELATWSKAHTHLHLAFVVGCTPKLRKQIRTTMARSDRYRRLSVLGDEPVAWSIGESEHQAIVQACDDGEAREAALLLAQHLARSALRVVAQLSPDSDVPGVRVALQMVMAWRDAERSSRAAR